MLFLLMKTITVMLYFHIVGGNLYPSLFSSHERQTLRSDLFTAATIIEDPHYRATLSPNSDI